MPEETIHISKIEISNFTHELKNPIAAIELFTDMLTKGIAGPLTKKQKTMLLEIAASNKKLTKLVNDYHKKHVV